MARVLIVDDSFVARKALGKILAELGHVVVAEAADGAQAFSEYSRHLPDIVTMDLNMPGISGAEATSKILASFPAALIIAVSASEERQVVLDALERGARHYIIKPADPEKVAAVVNSVLQQNIDQEKYRQLVRRLKDAGDISGEMGRGLAAVGHQPAKILIVDDSAVARKSLQEIVTALGHTVVGEAANGAQAFVEYIRHKPDIVTMDLTMEGMSGAEATSKIIASYPAARIIVISAMEERRVVIDALERGARHFIIKPITREKVASVLSSVLRQNFDQEKHKELVRRLKAAYESASSLRDITGEYVPPYRIGRDNNLIHVSINPTITATSCQTLEIELEEYLTGTPLVLIDFGTSGDFAVTALRQIDNLIQHIESSQGTVKAAAHSQALANSVSQAGTMPSLAAVLQCIAG